MQESTKLKPNSDFGNKGVPEKDSITCDSTTPTQQRRLCQTVAGLLQASHRWPSSNSPVAQTSHLH